MTDEWSDKEIEKPLRGAETDGARTEFYWADRVGADCTGKFGTFFDIATHIHENALAFWDRDLADVEVRANLRFVCAMGTWRAFHEDYGGFIARWDPDVRIGQEALVKGVWVLPESGAWVRDAGEVKAKTDKLIEKLDGDRERAYVTCDIYAANECRRCGRSWIEWENGGGRLPCGVQPGDTPQ